VAIKLVRPVRFSSEASRRSYQDEARLLAQLEHPAVVSLFDSGELPAGIVYLVLELLSGKDLETTLGMLGPAAPDQVSAFLRQVGDALSRAHEKGLLHRDVKPANVFVLDGQPLRFKLLDFGLARDAFSPSQTGENVVGTPRYIAPELLKGELPSPRSDLYCLAATAYEMLTATPVFRAESLADLTLEVLYKSAPRLSGTFPDVPARIETAFVRALSKDPEERPATVSEWLDSFLGALERMPPVQGLGRWPAWREGGG
jgi:serine/threonine protein kinase